MILIFRDISEIFKEKPHGIHAAPDIEDITKVHIHIHACLVFIWNIPALFRFTA